MTFDIIVAYCKNRGIGHNNNIPWKLSADLKRFAEITKKTNDTNKKNAVIMGRKTWDSLPSKYKPLPDRINIVITSQVDKFCCKNRVYYSPNFELAISYDEEIENTFVIGGEKIYTLALSHKDCRYIYATDIKEDFECDTFFPLSKNNFKLIEHSENLKENEITYSFLKYQKNGNLHPEYQYLNLLHNTIVKGDERETRNGTTWSSFGSKMEFNLDDGIPILTTKRVAWKTCIKELLWFISGNMEKLLKQQQISGTVDFMLALTQLILRG